MEGELHKESIFCDAQLLTTHTLSAKGPTLNCDSNVCFGRASFVDRSKNRRKDNVLMKLFVWLLSYFFVKKIPLSRRVGYVMDGSMGH